MSSLLIFLKRFRYLLRNDIDELSNYQDQTPLPEGFWIIRLAIPPKDYQETARVSAVQLGNDFILSSEDKKSVPPHLSVWAEQLTSPSQAYQFLIENRPDSPRKLVVRLNVDSIRNLKSSIFPEGKQFLDVLWIHLFKDSKQHKVRDTRAGANGHAGIVGLDEDSAPSSLSQKQKKKLRKDLRLQLAELASSTSSLLKIDNTSQ